MSRRHRRALAAVQAHGKIPDATASVDVACRRVCGALDDTLEELQRRRAWIERELAGATPYALLERVLDAAICRCREQQAIIERCS